MIVVRIWAGLGNQMFQYAYAKALQLRTGQEVYIDTERIYKEVLEPDLIPRRYGLDEFQISLKKYDGKDRKFSYLKQDTVMKKLLFRLSSKGMLSQHFYYDVGVCFKEELLAVKGDYYLMGVFQSEHYFREYREDLLKDFKLKKELNLPDNLKGILKKRNTVSVHIRRTDYRKIHMTLPAIYYERAKRYIEEKIENPYYLIFTDDPAWVGKNLEFKNSYLISGNTFQDYEELAIMSMCRNNIIANSTFSWWGAWLNQNPDKIVVAPRKWMGNQKSIVSEEWVIV